jgi:uncharacterized protein (DUF2384 family)
MNATHSAQDMSKVAPVAIKMFMNIAGHEWSLQEKDMRVLLGEPSRSTFYNWRSGKISSLSRDTLERVSYIAGIYKALHILFALPEQANAWIKKPNTAFNGHSALDVMLAGNVMDLARVRRYLDAQRG